MHRDKYFKFSFECELWGDSVYHKSYINYEVHEEIQDSHRTAQVNLAEYKEVWKFGFNTEKELAI